MLKIEDVRDFCVVFHRKDYENKMGQYRFTFN
jgi:hypothetical protein